MRFRKLLNVIIMTICLFHFCETVFCADDTQAKSINLINANKIIDDLKAEIVKNPKDIENRIDLGVFYFQLQEYEKAKQLFEEVLKIDPNNALAHYDLGKALIVQGDEDGGITECEKSLELGFDDINVYRTLSVEYFNKRELKKALKMYENIKRLEPKDDMAYYACGIIYIGLRNGWKAREEFKKAVEINPNNTEAHYELGWLYVGYDREYAEKELRRVLELNPNHEGARKELKKLEASK